MIKKKLESFLERNLEELLENIEKEENLIESDKYKKTHIPSFDDGLIAIKNGALELYPPNSKGSWPKIKPGKNVKVKIEGEEIEKNTKVNDASKVEIQVINEDSESSYEFSFSDDMVELILETKFISGKEYRLKDKEPNHVLQIEVEDVRQILPEPIDEAEIIEEMKRLGVDDNIVEVYYGEIKTAATSLESTKTVIARGKKVIPPEDGWIEYRFSTKERIVDYSLDADRIDLYDKGEFNSMEDGEVLAICHAPKEGAPGLTVTGAPVEPKEPKKPELKAGEGASLIKNEQEVVATASGRPKIDKNNRISVVPELVISKNVDVNTGHIKFKGDVKINGDVKDGFEVKAGGYVFVFGSVFNGEVYGDKGISVNKNLVGGSLIAGGRSAEYRKILPDIKKLDEIIKGINQVLDQLLQNPSFTDTETKSKDIGIVIKHIIEMKFPKVGDLIRDIKKSLPEEQEDEDKTIRKGIAYVESKLLRYGPYNIKSVDELKHMGKVLGGITELINRSIQDDTDITVKFAQNARIETNGKVYVTKEGLYHTSVIAKGEINIPGFCRGGRLYSAEKIVVGELGSKTGVKTQVEADEEGEVIVNKIYPGVSINVGKYFYKSCAEEYKVKFTKEGMKRG